ncbi:MAG: hypothetical protein NZ455_05450 [Bacteroidia bacterium]|nr:hypothetical protein [Bacteroidia bacterium]MDW8347870.1 hypothetical protein [Bacteroidia bacterium]
MRRVRKQCAAPKRSAARSTPTLWAYAQRNAHKDTPKKYQNLVTIIIS